MTLKSRFFNKLSYPENAVRIFAENKPVEQHNEIQSVKIASELIRIQAIDETPRHIKHTESQIEAIKQREISETGKLAYSLKLKIGAQVMLTANVNIEDRLVNGLVGKVVKFKLVDHQITIVYVKFNDKNPGLITMESDSFARQQQWVPIMKHEVSFGFKKNKSQPCIKRTQFPLALSWACTAHKVQVLILDEDVTSFDLHRQRSFNQCQMYVSSSRITSLDRMFLIGNYHKTAIKENSSAKQEYQRLRQENKFTTLPFVSLSE